MCFSYAAVKRTKKSFLFFQDYCLSSVLLQFWKGSKLHWVRVSEEALATFDFANVVFHLQVIKATWKRSIDCEQVENTRTHQKGDLLREFEGIDLELLGGLTAVAPSWDPWQNLVPIIYVSIFPAETLLTPTWRARLNMAASSISAKVLGACCRGCNALPAVFCPGRVSSSEFKVFEGRICCLDILQNANSNDFQMN